MAIQININSLNTLSNHKPLSAILKLNDADKRITIACIADNIEIWSSYWSSKSFIFNAEACLVHLKLDDEHDFDIVTYEI